MLQAAPPVLNVGPYSLAFSLEAQQLGHQLCSYSPFCYFRDTGAPLWVLSSLLSQEQLVGVPTGLGSGACEAEGLVAFENICVYFGVFFCISSCIMTSPLRVIVASQEKPRNRHQLFILK